MANEYADAEELKATLELSEETFADADIDLALTAASRGIDSATGRRFWKDATAKTRYYSAPAWDRVWINDLAELTSVTTDPGDDGTFTQAWTLNTDFFLEPLNAAEDGWPWTSIRVRGRSGLYLPVCERSVKVVGKFGWAAVPEPIVQATKIIASKLMKRSREAPFGVVGMGMDGAAVRIATSDAEVAGLVGPYVRANHTDG